MSIFADLRRVHTDHGSHIEPPFDDRWDDLTKLQWHARVAEVDTGVRVEVSSGGYSTKRRGRWVPERGSYSLIVGSAGIGPFRFNAAWDFISGVWMGAEAARDTRPPLPPRDPGMRGF